MTRIFRKVGKAATECREAHGVRGACSRFRARWVDRKLQQAGRTPYASRGSPAERHSQSELLLKAQWLFVLPLAPGILLKPLGFLLTRIFRSAAKSAKPQPNVAKRMECVELAPAFEHAGWTESSSKLAALIRFASFANHVLALTVPSGPHSCVCLCAPADACRKEDRWQ